MADKRRRPDATGPELFSAWIDAGTPKYRDFAATLAQQGRYKSASTALSGIGYYSGRDKWQERKADALTIHAQKKLEEASMIDADTFHRTSKELNRRAKFTTSEHLDSIVKMRESVRRPAAKADINVTHGGTVTHQHRDLTMFSDDEVAAMADLAERRKAGLVPS